MQGRSSDATVSLETAKVQGPGCSEDLPDETAQASSHQDARLTSPDGPSRAATLQRKPMVSLKVLGTRHYPCPFIITHSAPLYARRRPFSPRPLLSRTHTHAHSREAHSLRSFNLANWQLKLLGSAHWFFVFRTPVGSAFSNLLVGANTKFTTRVLLKEARPCLYYSIIY